MIDTPISRQIAPPPACSGSSAPYRTYPRRTQLEAPRGLRRHWQALEVVEGQVNDHRGAAILLPALPDAETLIAEEGYDSDGFRTALAGRGTEACIPGRANRREPLAYDTELYQRRNLSERRFGRLKDWRRIATRYDRCAHTFFSAIYIAATVIFWL